MTTGLKRDTIDKFYTKESIASNLISIWKTKVDVNGSVIEPSAGNGSFFNLLKEEYNVLAYDIEPESNDIIQRDFLDVELPDNVHVIGNPPFGRQSSLAKKFIKKSCDKALSVSFILPKSFKKDSYQKVFPLDFHLIHSEDLPKNSFTVNNKEHNVECVFQIWIKKDTNREIEYKEEPINFSFVKKEEADFSIKRVGINAGKISTNVLDKSIQSHYFIKVNIDTDVFEERYLGVVFNHNNTVGPKSISKQELIKEINKISV